MDNPLEYGDEEYIDEDGEPIAVAQMDNSRSSFGGPSVEGRSQGGSPARRGNAGMGMTKGKAFAGSGANTRGGNTNAR